jgi:hypothetical protein
MDQNALRKGILVPAGKDRFSEGERMIWGSHPARNEAIGQGHGRSALCI